MLLSPVKKKKLVLSESGETYAQISSKQIFQWVLMYEDNSRWTFSVEEVFYELLNGCFVQKWSFKVIKYLRIF